MSSFVVFAVDDIIIIMMMMIISKSSSSSSSSSSCSSRSSSIRSIIYEVFYLFPMNYGARKGGRGIDPLR